MSNIFQFCQLEHLTVPYYKGKLTVLPTDIVLAWKKLAQAYFIPGDLSKKKFFFN
jgi:hypothetical protein